MDYAARSANAAEQTAFAAYDQAYITFWQTLATVGAFGAAVVAALYAKRAAEVAGRALTDLERPYLFIYGIRGVVAEAQDNFRPRLNYKLSNNGRFAARVTDVQTRFGLKDGERYPGLITQADHALLQESVIASSEVRELFYNVGHSQLAQRTGQRTLTAEGYQLPAGTIFQVLIAYDGPITKGHISAHCWRYRRDPNGWVEVEDSDYTFMN